MSEEKKDINSEKKEAPRQEPPKADAPKQEAPKIEAPKQEIPKAEVQKPEAAKPETQAAPAAEVKKPEEKKLESPVNCSVCNKSIKKKRYYYRNGKYFCTKRCWAKTKVKEAKDPGEKTAEPEAKQ